MSQLVLIAGISRSGKSSLAKELCARLSSSIHLDQDQFVKPESEIPLIRGRIDWETPDSIDWQNWNKAILKGLGEHSYVIAEGIFALTDTDLIKQASLIILLEIDEAEFKARRKDETRWGEEPDWFIQHVWNAHIQYHNPHKIHPDFVLNSYSVDDIQQIISTLQSNY